ncbi:MAG: glycosyl hydrolase, partial [Luteolibacter sp.]
APKMTGAREPALPPGRDFDYINADVIMDSLTVKDGQLVLPHGVSYKVLVLPKQDTMRPAVLRKIRDLIQAGATVLGPPPVKSPSLQNQPQADEEVRAITAEIWGNGEFNKAGERPLGKGRIIWEKNLTEIFNSTQTPPAIEFRGAASDTHLLFTQRRSKDAEIYFISNQKDRPESINCAFRVTGRQPELWNAVTGERRLLPEWSEQSGQTIVPLVFAPTQSWFVVFRAPGKSAAGKNFPEATLLTTLEKPWTVAFDPKWGGPAEIEFATLSDWTQHADEGIKHYSGTATYQTTFDLARTGERLILDLGKVCDLATVKLNGKDLGTVWTAPWQVDLGGAAKTGSNTLEITITNPWNNRLVGDLKLPPAQRRTSLSLATVKPNSPLQAAGLLGPVTIHQITTP